ncbi:gamma-glutamyltranspeptidase/glutathione hydrolase [Curtobacterium luteum]|uniref:Gamma-glutamyltranspeptidase/glutathione hydrolase n=1 Tax=Curtobacterium luteum TaxID=33881 RepID=A0A8H9G9K5_9MICO|nr:gamma-glutamyltransferase [Curtobacterium luteum]MBM7803634.1 gamma-glutamyltranspeptidase/glutathione hydrolase [Curtobacterium luteum]NUU50095.1 transferase [Curtobacterium luteum]GGK99063.1 transferase [Curtobacterium luteum]
MPTPNPAFTPPTSTPTRPDLAGTFGAAAATHWTATATAQSVLERGGNAFDAAVAGAFVLHVVEPHLNGPGGDLTAVFATADDPTPVVLCGQGPAPAGATREHYLAEGLDLVPGAGALAATVPGAVDAWLLLLRDRGTWDLADVLAPAIGYARDGHPIAPAVVRTITAVQDLFRDHWPTSAERWLPGGAMPEPGTVVRNEALASVLERLVAAGGDHAGRTARIDAARTEWAEGFVAQAIDRFVREPHRHASGTDHAGVIRASDLQAFRATYEPATTTEFRGCTIAKTGPWGQGPALLETLRLLEPLDDALLDPSTEVGAHTIVEAQKLALADRDLFYGDGEVPLDVLLSDAYTDERRTLIGERASAELRPGTVPGFEHATPPLRTTYATDAGGSAGEPTVRVARDAARAVPVEDRGEPFVAPTGETRGDTVHIDVVDRWGNMVSATPSGGWLQSSPTIPELGFCLGTRLQMTWLEEGTATTLTPGRRPRTTLTPTLVLRDGQPVAALGSPGGDQQDQWQLLFLLRWIVGGYSPQQAIDAPALHTTSFPGSFWPRTWEPAGLVVEDRLGADVIAGLEARGHVVTRAGDWALGRLCCVTREPSSGVVGAAANPRGAQGYAIAR